MNKQSFKFTIEPWITTAEFLEYTTNIFKVLRRDMKIPSENHQGSFSIIKAPDWINVMALTSKNEVVLVEQFRYGVEEATLELVGGVCDAGEEPLEAAKRELLEETGYAGSECVYLGKVSSNPAIQNNYTHTILINNCEKMGEQNLDINERINVHVIPYQQFLELIRTEEIHHALVVAATAKYMLSEHYNNEN